MSALAGTLHLGRRPGTEHNATDLLGGGRADLTIRTGDVADEHDVRRLTYQVSFTERLTSHASGSTIERAACEQSSSAMSSKNPELVVARARGSLGFNRRRNSL